MGTVADVKAALKALRASVAALDPELLAPDTAVSLVELFSVGEKICAAGKALAARLKKEGHGDQANRVKALVKPSISAWAQS